MPPLDCNQSRVAEQLVDKRVFPDISVLLAGLLDPSSDSAAVLFGAAGSLILSRHTESTAIRVLRSAAPHLVAEFGDRLIELGTHVQIERVESTNSSDLVGRRRLSKEDKQVVHDAVIAKADVLVTHDSDIFRAAPPSLRVSSPSSLNWDDLSAGNVQLGDGEFTFIGFFFPHWTSDAVQGADQHFYFFEVAGFIRAHYENSRRSARLAWNTPIGARDSIRLPLEVQRERYHFLAAAIGRDSVTFFADGKISSKKVRLGAVPRPTTFHPFMSASSEHQISGGCRFRVEPRVLGEKEIRRLWHARSTRLSDGEVQYAEWTRKSRLIVLP